MSNLALIAVLLRLAGIWLVWLRGFTAVALLTSGVAGAEPMVYAIYLAQVLGPVAMGLVMLIWPVALARFLVPRNLRQEDAIGWLPADFGAVALGVTGIVFIVTTLGNATTWNVIFVFLDAQHPELRTLRADAVLGVIVRLVIGFTLLFGAVGFSRVLSFGRRARLDSKLP